MKGVCARLKPGKNRTPQKLAQTNVYGRNDAMVFGYSRVSKGDPDNARLQQHAFKAAQIGRASCRERV